MTSTVKGLVSRSQVVLIALLLVVFYNQSLWTELSRQAGGISEHGWLMVSLFILVFLYLVMLLALFRFKYVFKPLVIFILISSAFASYFMTTYGIAISKEMLQNVLETDMGEALELLNFRLLLYALLLGLLPACVVYKLDFQYRPFFRQLVSNIILVTISLVLIVTLVLVNYAGYSTFLRTNRHLRYLLNPTNYIYALSANAKRLLTTDSQVIAALGQDARLTSGWQQRGKKNLLILVLGETARAENFSLNGYAKSTNPLLSKEDVVSFDKFYSCGTATAASVPCMFSGFDHKSSTDTKARGTENVLDVISHAGVDVLWRDNNSGCKGVCDRVETSDMSKLAIRDLCNQNECYDEILLYQLQEYVDQLQNDAIIVLHQKGSHGPAYHLRYPQAFETFTPVCTTSQLKDCPQETVINAYDNTIKYTDYFLSRVIHQLKNNESQFNTAMVYVSDHGESLGERGIYLHGLPYMIAPDQQKHVPFIVWLSTGFKNTTGIDQKCLQHISARPFSHDNLFHSLIGLAGVSTSVYEGKLDLFSQCRNPPLVIARDGHQ